MLSFILRLGVGAILLAALSNLSTAQGSPATAPSNPELEAALDQFLKLGDQSAEQAARHLLDLEQKLRDDEAAGSQARLLNYLVFHYNDEDQDEKAAAAQQRLARLAERTDFADVWVQALTSELTILPEGDNRSREIAIAEQMLQYLPAVSSHRVKYVGYFTIAYVYLNAGLFDSALVQFQSALDVVNSYQDWRNDFRRLNLKWQIALLHAELKNWPLALLIADETRQEAIAQEHLRFLPDVHMVEGRALTELGRLDEAVVALNEGIAWARKLDSQAIRRDLYEKLAQVHLQRDQIADARHFLEQALIVAKNTRQDRQTIEFDLGFVLVREGRHESGLARMLEALQVIEKRNDRIQLVPMLARLADAYRQLRRFDLEGQTLRRMHAVSVSLFDQNRDAKVSELQERFAAKESVQTINSLKQENVLKEAELISEKLRQRVAQLIVIAALLALALIYLLYRKVRRANAALENANVELAYQSTHDQLTGLWNRRYFQEQMQAELARGRRRSADIHSTDGILLLDVDHFKSVNDRFGHAAGDAVLIEVAKRLNVSTRTQDLVVRWGGEEFLLLFRDVDFDTLATLCQRALERIGATPIIFEGREIQIAASAGFLVMPFAGIDIQKLDTEKLIALADMALYLGKANGRNRAYGLRGLKQPFEKLQQMLEDNISEAIESSAIDFVVIEGARP